MGRQIVKQPDGLLAVWSTVVDDWVMFDCTPDGLVEAYAEEAAENTRVRVRRFIEAVEAGEPRRVYYQFARSFDELQAERLERHGSAPWPPVAAT